MMFHLSTDNAIDMMTKNGYSVIGARGLLHLADSQKMADDGFFKVASEGHGWYVIWR